MSQQRVNPILKIDPEFESRIPPLTSDEFQQLEQNILSEGAVLMPLIVWGDTIVDGHNRYKIAQAHPEIIFTVYDKDFENRYEALAWICKNQLGRRNLTPVQKKVLIGERYNAEKMANGGDRKSDQAKSVDQNDPLILEHGTRTKIAEETGTSEGYVQRADEFSKGVTVADEDFPGFRQEVLSGKIKPTQKEMRTVARASPEERKSIIDQVFRRGNKSPNEGRGKKRKKLPDVTLNTTADADEHTVTAESAVKQFEWKVTRTLQSFDATLEDWPQLITDESYRQQVIATLQDLKHYILHIEGGTRYEWNHEARKIAL